MPNRECPEVSTEIPPHPDAHLLDDYSVVVDSHRRYLEVSDGFCELLGYSREEMCGQRFDTFTMPRTNDIEIVYELFLKCGYMHGIWIFQHRRGTKILVRYEAWRRKDNLAECHMELLGAGA